MGLVNRVDYILFLQISETLPEVFFHINDYLSQYDIKLIPISFVDLKGLDNSINQLMISVSSDIDTRREVLKFQCNYLNFLLNSNHFCYIDISSFSKPEFSTRYKKGVYTYIQLPIELNILSAQMISILNNKSSDYSKSWPFGKRASSSFL